jgi:urease accessory protein UreF
MTKSGTKAVVSEPAELLGDAHPLIEQLGSAEELSITSRAAAAIEFRRVTDVAALQQFLAAYRTQILFPIELPVIVAAHGHAARNEVRELLALDQRLAQESSIRDFAMASCRVGQRQLSKLRALRDQRVVQRYLAAIEAGEARGWHTLVYGLSLSVFSLPVRQGLQNYADHTVRGFVESAAKSLRLSQAAVDETLAAEISHVPRAIEMALATNATLALA